MKENYLEILKACREELDCFIAHATELQDAIYDEMREARNENKWNKECEYLYHAGTCLERALGSLESHFFLHWDNAELFLEKIEE